MDCKGLDQDAYQLVVAIGERYEDELEQTAIRVAARNGNKWAAPDDVLEAAAVIAESKPTFITGH